MKYLEVKSKRKQTRFKVLQILSHEFLWTPTPAYYLFAVSLFMMLRERWRLKTISLLPFMALPASFDYIKRDYYTNLFVKERKELR